MGAILEMTEAAGPFHAEAQSESFYVFTDHIDRRLTGSREGGNEMRGTFGVPIDLVRQFESALNQVANASFVAAKMNSSLSESPWTVTHQDNEYVFAGPVITFLTTDVRQLIQTIELEYADPPWLLREVAALQGMLMARAKKSPAERAKDLRTHLAGLDFDALASPDGGADDLRAIASAAMSAVDAEASVTKAVRDARNAGRTWTQVAAVLGVTRQAAQEKHDR